jgi:hypothetical protein
LALSFFDIFAKIPHFRQSPAWQSRRGRRETSWPLDTRARKRFGGQALFTTSDEEDTSRKGEKRKSKLLLAKGERKNTMGASYDGTQATTGAACGGDDVVEQQHAHSTRRASSMTSSFVAWFAVGFVAVMMMAVAAVVGGVGVGGGAGHASDVGASSASSASLSSLGAAYNLGGTGGLRVIPKSERPGWGGIAEPTAGAEKGKGKGKQHAATAAAEASSEGTELGKGGRKGGKEDQLLAALGVSKKKQQSSGSSNAAEEDDAVKQRSVALHRRRKASAEKLGIRRHDGKDYEEANLGQAKGVPPLVFINVPEVRLYKLNSVDT